MKFYLPDSQDHVDPSFDFATEQRSATRTRQRDDLYIHEVFSRRVLDGILVSKGIVDGFGDTGSRYTIAQRQRIYRLGAREFFRLDQSPQKPFPIMGDCGAFTYVNEPVPPYSVDAVIDFYLHCGFDQGISVDHVILAYNPTWSDAEVPAELRERQRLTLELAADFLRRHRQQRLPFEPLGVAQGWSPASYAQAVEALQRIGYSYIAMGGMVPLKTAEIYQCLRGVATVRAPQTRLHLLGVTRTGEWQDFAGLGVASFDSTSPLRQAFKDDKDNYYTLDRTYPAIRIPQVEGNAKLQKSIQAGWVAQEQAQALEQACLLAMQRFDAGAAPVEEVVEVLKRYEDLFLNCEAPGRKRAGQSLQVKKSRADEFREVLTDRPWQRCPCEVCRSLGHHVILFRGAERNRRRGFHNIWVFYQRLQRGLAGAAGVVANEANEANENHR